MEDTVIEISNPVTIQGSIGIKDDSISLKVAMTLFTYADFSTISNIKNFAISCIQRGKIFEEAYNELNK